MGGIPASGHRNSGFPLPGIRNSGLRNSSPTMPRGYFVLGPATAAKWRPHDLAENTPLRHGYNGKLAREGNRRQCAWRSTSGPHWIVNELGSCRRNDYARTCGNDGHLLGAGGDRAWRSCGWRDFGLFGR